ncbi:MAG: hypothetical protein ABIK28_19455, partial [Planctomycetota bacterium]
MHFKGACLLLISILGLTWLGTAIPAWGQAAQEGAVQAVEELDLFSLLWKGGWVMIPIAVASVLALTLTIERFISLRRSKVVPADFLPGYRSEIEKGNRDEKSGISFCTGRPSVISNMIRNAIPKIKRGERGLQEALEDAG